MWLSKLGLAVVSGGIGLLACGCGPDETMAIRTIERELLCDFGRFKVLQERSDAPVQVGILAPSLTPIPDRGIESTDLPALVMPPPSRVRFSVRSEEAGCALRASVGAHYELRELLERSKTEARVRFSIDRNGENVFERTLALGEGDSAHWHPIEGLERLQENDRIELATEWAGAAPSIPSGSMSLGFGRLSLERETSRRRSSPSEEAPNILLVVMDTLRADRLGCYGYGKDTSPHLDALAREGLLYEEAHATSSWTWPSTASILTGLSPEAHGVRSNRTCHLAAALQTLPEILQRAGVTTAAFSGNPLVVPEKSFDQGFEHFDFDWGWRKSDELVPALLAWLDANQQHRFFLYAHLVDPHTPHRPRAEDLARLAGSPPQDFPSDGLDVYAGRLMRSEISAEEIAPAHRAWMSDSYDACVATGDHYFGLILEHLRRLDLERKTLVIFTSDHGEELLDHDLLAHGHGLHRELVRVPLVMRGPGLPRGERIQTPVSNRHLAPTLAAVCGAALPGTSDAVHLAQPEHVPLQGVLFSTEKGRWDGRKQVAIYGLRSRDYALHFAPSVAQEASGQPTARFLRLFDVARDPLEQTDVSADLPEVVATLRSMLETRLDELELAGRSIAIPSSSGDATEHLLEALGYSDEGAQEQ